MNWYGPQGDCGCCEEEAPQVECNACEESTAPEIMHVEISGLSNETFCSVCANYNTTFELESESINFSCFPFTGIGCNWGLFVDTGDCGGPDSMYLTVCYNSGTDTTEIRFVMIIADTSAFTIEWRLEVSGQFDCNTFDELEIPFDFGTSNHCKSSGAAIKLSSGPVP